MWRGRDIRCAVHLLGVQPNSLCLCTVTRPSALSDSSAIVDLSTDFVLSPIRIIDTVSPHILVTHKGSPMLK